MTQNLKAVKHLVSVSPICEKCKGRFWNENDQKATQEAVLNEFGVIANNCVTGEMGTVYCPYAKK